MKFLSITKTGLEFTYVVNLDPEKIKTSSIISVDEKGKDQITTIEIPDEDYLYTETWTANPQESDESNAEFEKRMNDFATKCKEEMILLSRERLLQIQKLREPKNTEKEVLEGEGEEF